MSLGDVCDDDDEKAMTRKEHGGTRAVDRSETFAPVAREELLAGVPTLPMNRPLIYVFISISYTTYKALRTKRKSPHYWISHELTRSTFHDKSPKMVCSYNI